MRTATSADVGISRTTLYAHGSKHDAHCARQECAANAALRRETRARCGTHGSMILTGFRRKSTDKKDLTRSKEHILAGLWYSTSTLQLSKNKLCPPRLK